MCYLTATARGSGDISTLHVRIELTDDVTTGTSTTRYAVGPDAVTEILREWMAAMCGRRQPPVGG